MNDTGYTDDELAERISRGDWGGDTLPPRLDGVTQAVSQRQHRRRTTIGTGLATGLAAAAVVTAVVAFSPESSPSSDRGPVEQPTSTTSTTSTTPPLPRCTTDGIRLLLSHGPFGGTVRRPSQVAYVQNIGRRTCVFGEQPTLQVGGSAVTMRKADLRPWVLRPQEALLLTVTAPPPSSCLRGPGSVARDLSIELEGNLYTFRFPGMRVDGCAPPVLTDAHVGLPPPRDR